MAAMGGIHVTGSLSQPNVKLLAYHLKMSSPSSDTHGRKSWLCNYNGKNTSFSLVWAQGTVINVDTDKEEVMIKDDTGKIKLIEATISAATIEDLYVLEPGQYVMAVGELISNDNEPVLLTHKLKILEERENLAALWPLEVQHQLRYAPKQQ